MRSLPDKFLGAMIAVQPLPGAPRYGGNDKGILAQALSDLQHYTEAGADAIVSPDFTGGLRIASAMIRPHVVTFLDQMLKSDDNLRVEEVIVPSGFTEKSLADLLQPDRNHIMLALRDGARWVFNPEGAQTLKPGMTLVIMATPEGRRAVESALGWV